MDNNLLPDLPEAQKGQAYKIALFWKIDPENSKSGFYDWRLRMAGKGYLTKIYRADGGTIPYSYIEVAPMENL